MTVEGPAFHPDRCASEPSVSPSIESWPARDAKVGDLDIRRALPVRERRLVGPWCFLDRYGPLSFTDEKPMDLAPHPHIGLQTVSWLFDGEILHRDSVGSEMLIRPGQLNLMTSGGGITHTEETPGENRGRLSGAQLWIALPEGARHGEPSFEHHAELPQLELDRCIAKVILGSVGAAQSSATSFSPIVAAELGLTGGGRSSVPLRKEFEHALFVCEGRASLDGVLLVPGVLYYLGPGRDELELGSSADSRLLLIGGEPFPEPVLMWWNFVARSPEEIAAAREDWAAGRRFGTVHGYDGPPMDAPPLRGRVSPPAAS